jgi:hypothetical protein
VIKVEDLWPRGPGLKPHFGDHFLGSIHLDQSLEQKLWKNLTWHCCMCCKPANGRVDFEEWSAYQIQLHGTEWIVTKVPPLPPQKKRTNYIVLNSDSLTVSLWNRCYIQKNPKLTYKTTPWGLSEVLEYPFEVY